MEDGTVKRPFLRKGTGLKRFYKDIDVDGYFSNVSPTKPITNNQLTERNREYVDPVANYTSFHPSSVLKSADSPKRNLNVRFSHEPIKKVPEHCRSRRALNFGDDEKLRDKENLNPSIANVSELSSSDEDSESERDDDEEDAEGEWETEDQEEDDDDESVVQISDSLVEEVFKSILKAKADELLPKLNHDQILHRQLPDPAPTTTDRPLSPRSMVERELEMFEKMERMTTNQSFCSTASTVQRFVHTELRLSPIVDTSPNEPRLPPPPQQFLAPFNHLPNVKQSQPQKLPPASASQNPNISSIQSRNPVTSRKPDGLKYLQGLSQVRSSAPFQSHQANQKLHKPETVAGTTVQQQHPPPSAVQQHYQQHPPPSGVQQHHQHHPPPSTVANPAIENRKQELEQDDQYLRALLTMRIHQLESQIVLHRTENKRMQDVRTQLEAELAGLEKKKKEFEVRQVKELEVIDDLKKRLKRDQEKLSKELTTTQKTKTTEEEAESELKQLRLKVAEQDKELKVRSGRWASSARNFKTEIEELKTENEKLQKCILELKNDKYKLNQRLRRLAKLPADDVAQSSTSKDITPPPPKSADMTRSRPLQPLDKSSSRSPNVSSSHALPVTRTSNTAQVSLHTGRSEQNREEVDSNGVRRIFSDTGECLEVHYPNGDIKDLREVNSTGASKYYFKEADSWEIIYPDGTETLQFGSGEVQTKFPNGVREIKYVTGAVRRIFPDGAEESVFPDKTLVRTGSDGEREIHLPNGQVEHHSKNLKMRIYPDGTEKVLYNDGSSLTRYSSGRQRFRNSAGEIVYDRIGTETTTTESPGNGTSQSSTSSATVSSRPRI